MNIWATLTSGIVGLIGNWFDIKKAKAEAEAESYRRLQQTEADWDLRAQEAARYSWKDEFITVIWFAPLIYGWFEPEEANAWIAFVGDLPYWYQFGMFGIIAASFGLRWYFKQQNFHVVKKGQ